MNINRMITVIDYGMGNIKSVLNALDYINIPNIFSCDERVIADSRGIILPGVGAFGDGMNNLKKRGLIEVLNREVVELGKPLLGICLGMQLLCSESLEFGINRGLGWIEGSVVPFEEGMGLRVPHVGWNDISIVHENCLISQTEKPDYYFVHSFYVRCAESANVVATCEYGTTFAAVINRGNIWGTQFHPEKSQEAGLKLLKNFAEIAL